MNHDKYMENVGDQILKFLLDGKLIQTRMNRDTKKQEFAITNFGEFVYKALKVMRTKN